LPLVGRINAAKESLNEATAKKVVWVWYTPVSSAQTTLSVISAATLGAHLTHVWHSNCTSWMITICACATFRPQIHMIMVRGYLLGTLYRFLLLYTIAWCSILSISRVANHQYDKLTTFPSSTFMLFLLTPIAMQFLYIIVNFVTRAFDLRRRSMWSTVMCFL